MAVATGVSALVASMALAFPFSAPASAGSCAHAKAPAKAISAKQAQSAVACLINKRRHSHGLGGLKLNHDLSKAARKHSQYMGAHNCFDHECAGEATLDSRLRGVHYLFSGLSSWLYGENIAYGTGSYGSPAAMVTAWMHSAGHRANILSGNFRDFGVGVVWGTLTDPHGDGGLYTADFGHRR